MDDVRRPRPDSGFSLVELLLVIVILGVLTSIVVLAVSGVTSDAEESACQADRRTLEKAAEAYFAQTLSTTIPPTGTDEPYEQALVDREFLRTTSRYFDLDEYGELVDLGHPCVP